MRSRVVEGGGMKVSIVIPMFNEEESIAAVLRDLSTWIQSSGETRVHEIIVVDDGSSDRSRTILESFPGITVLHHPINMGYGAALKTGIKHATGETVLTMDSDGQHDPSDIGPLLDAMEQYDLVSGDRRQRGDRSPAWRKPGKWLLRHLVSYLAGRSIPDFNCGFRAFVREDALRYIHLCPRGFSFSTTLLLAFLRQGNFVAFHPVAPFRRTPNSQSRVTVRVGLETVLLLLRLMTLFSPLKLFIPVSFASIALGAIWGGVYVFAGRGLSMAGLLFLITGLLLFFFGLVIDQVSAMRREKYE
jgi:glycosyltransferase involved in cell wall biosynthesis